MKSTIVESLGGGVALLDYDNDGWIDIYLINGLTYDAMDGKAAPAHAALFHNNHDGTFTNVADKAGVTNDRWGNATPTLLRNVNNDHHHWVEFKIVGGPGHPRDATGATIFLTAGKITQGGDVLSGGSFASSNDPRIHFGLSTATSLDDVTIHWPGGEVEKVKVPAVDRIYTIEEGKGITSELRNAGAHL